MICCCFFSPYLPPIRIALSPFRAESLLFTVLIFPCSSSWNICDCNAAAHAVITLSLASQSGWASSSSVRQTPPSPPRSSLSNLLPASTVFPESAISASKSVLHPRVAVLLGVNTRWHVPLLFCRGISTVPAAWWGLRCALTFLGELLATDGGVVGSSWSVEKRFRVTEVFLAVLWCCASAYLSFFFTDCLMARWLLYYTPQATLVRLLTVDSINAYITSWVLYLSGGSEDPRLLLPAWISIASTLTILYHLTHHNQHPKINIRKETYASISVFSIASFISMVSLLLQLHLSRVNDPPVPLFLIARSVWKVLCEWAIKGIGPVGRDEVRAGGWTREL